MRQNQMSRRSQGMDCLLLVLLVVLCSLENSWASTLGRQRTVKAGASVSGTVQAAYTMPLWHATFNSNNQFIESAIDDSAAGLASGVAPVTRPVPENSTGADAGGAAVQPPQEEDEQQNGESRAALSNSKAISGGIINYVDFVPAAEVQDVERLRELLLLPQPTSSSVATGSGSVLVLSPMDTQSRQATLNEARLFSIKNNNNITVLPPASTSTTTTRLVPDVDLLGTVYRAPPAAMPVSMPMSMPMPMQYFRQRQNNVAPAGGYASMGGLPYSLYNWADNNAVSVPLVPITLGGNEVSYVPLSLRGLRQMNAIAAAHALSGQAGMPVRESDDSQAINLDLSSGERSDEAAIALAAGSAALNSVKDENVAGVGAAAASSEDAGAGELGGLHLFGTRRRGQAAGSRKPLAALAQNLRRVQFL